MDSRDLRGCKPQENSAGKVFLTEAAILSPRQRVIKFLSENRTRRMTLYRNVIKASVYRAIFMPVSHELRGGVTCEAARLMHPSR